MPLRAKEEPVDEPYGRVAVIPEESEEHGRAEHLGHEEEATSVVDQKTEALLGADELGDHDDEERQRDAEPDAREHLGERRRQDHPKEELRRPRAEALRRTHEQRIELTARMHRGQE